MNLRKTAVAVAIAGIAAAPLAATAETTVSGIVQIQIKGESIGNLSDNVSEAAEDIGDEISDAVDDLQDQDTTDTDGDNEEDNDDASEDVNIGAGDVRINIASNHELNSGLEGYGNVGLTLDDLLGEEGGEKVPGGPTVKADNVYVGIKGGFGDFRIGEIPVTAEYGQLANDIFDVSGDIGDGLSYTGVFGPATIGLNYAFEAPLYGPDSDTIGVGAKVALGGVTLAAGANQFNNVPATVDADGNALTVEDQLAFSVGGAFAYGGASIALQYWNREGLGDADDTTSIGAKVGYGFGDLSANVTYQLLQDDPDAGEEEQAIRLDLVYDLGGGMDISSRITSFTNDDIDDREKTEYRVQFTKAF